MDNDGYPDDEELERIRMWPSEDLLGLLAFVEARCRYADWGWRRRGSTYRVSTFGWSGNESLIGALQANWTFWVLCWQSSRRGGHYLFRVPKGVKGKRPTADQFTSLERASEQGCVSFSRHSLASAAKHLLAALQ